MKRILVLGSINIDHSYELERIVRPGETVASRAYRTAWGGKGLNQAIALAKAGAETALAAQLSAGDRPGLEKFCAPFGLDLSKVRGLDCPSGHAIIQVESSGQNSIIIAAGANGRMEDETISAVDDYGPGDILLLQNEVDRMPEIICRGKEQGMTVALNPSPCTSEMLDWPLELVDIFILNETEGEYISGSAQVEEMLGALAAKFPAAGIVTDPGSTGLHIPPGRGRAQGGGSESRGGGHHCRRRYIYRLFPGGPFTRQKREGGHGACYPGGGHYRVQTGGGRVHSTGKGS